MAEPIASAGADSSSEEAAHAPMFVESVRIQNFRGMRDMTVDFEPSLTVLVGPNNSGKSRILRALGLALGGLRVDEDDLTKGGSDSATIDFVIAPATTASDGSQTFSDALGARLDPDVVDPVLDRERFAFRLTISSSGEGRGAQSKFERFTFDEPTNDWIITSSPKALDREQLGSFSAHLVDTQRDLSVELRQPGSSIRRILSDLEVPDSVRDDLEQQLGTLGGHIISESRTLAAVQKALATANAALDGFGSPSLNPLPISLEELSRSVSIDLDSGGGALPMRLHGSGPRSLASLLVQAVFYERRLGKDGPELRPLPVTLLEEPENHLHPQMQAELPELLRGLPGQTILSTHSPTLLTEVHPHTIRILRSDHALDFKPDSAAAGRLRKSEFNATEIEVLRRQIERPFGELLFCTAIVIGDGATERALLPPLIRHSLGSAGSGVSVIDPGGMKGPSTAAAIKFAKTMGLPWFLFADDDKDGHEAVSQHCPGHDDPDSENYGRAFSTGNGAGIEKLLLKNHLSVCKAALSKLNPTLSSISDEEVPRLMKKSKGAAGRAIAYQLIASSKPEDWPEPIQRLIKGLGDALRD